MGAQSEVDRYRRDVQSLQSKIASESSKVASARERENRARQQAATSRSTSSQSSKLREADRHGKESVEAEKRRSGFEKRLADKQKSLYQAAAKLDKERTAAQQSALKRLEERARSSELQFREPFEPNVPWHQKAPGGTPFYSTLSPPVASLQTSTVLSNVQDGVFISHASEDKEEVAKPLAELLSGRGVKVWYDDFTLTVGDSLRRTIDRGLASSRFGVVVLSADFFRKEWPQAELDGLVAKQRATGDKVILPIWHRLTKDDVLEQSPTLADLKALNTSFMTMAEIADAIAAVVKG